MSSGSRASSADPERDPARVLAASSPPAEGMSANPAAARRWAGAASHSASHCCNVIGSPATFGDLEAQAASHKGDGVKSAGCDALRSACNTLFFSESVVEDNNTDETLERSGARGMQSGPMPVANLPIEDGASVRRAEMMLTPHKDLMHVRKARPEGGPLQGRGAANDAVAGGEKDGGIFLPRSALEKRTLQEAAGAGAAKRRRVQPPAPHSQDQGAHVSGSSGMLAPGAANRNQVRSCVLDCVDSMNRQAQHRTGSGSRSSCASSSRAVMQHLDAMKGFHPWKPPEGIGRSRGHSAPEAAASRVAPARGRRIELIGACVVKQPSRAGASQVKRFLLSPACVIAVNARSRSCLLTSWS